MENRESSERYKRCRGHLLRGVMVMNGSFYIDTTKIPVRLYEEALQRHIYNPTEIVRDVCRLAGWSTPKYRIVRNTPTGMLCSVTVNGYEIYSGHPGRQWKGAVHKASAHFLNFLGFTMDLRDQTEFFRKRPHQKLEELRYDLDMRIRDFMGWSSSQRGAHHAENSTSKITYKRGECPMDVNPPSNRGDRPHKMSQSGPHHAENSTSKITYKRGECPMDVNPPSNRGEGPHETSQSVAQEEKHSTCDMAYERDESPIELDLPSNRANSLLESSPLSNIRVHGTRKRACRSFGSPKRLQRRRLKRQSSRPEAASSHARNKPSKNLKDTPDSKNTWKKNTFMSKCRQMLKSVVRL